MLAEAQPPPPERLQSRSHGRCRRCLSTLGHLGPEGLAFGPHGHSAPTGTEHTSLQDECAPSHRPHGNNPTGPGYATARRRQSRTALRCRLTQRLEERFLHGLMTRLRCDKGLHEAKGKISKSYKKREADEKLKIQKFKKRQ